VSRRAAPAAPRAARRPPRRAKRTRDPEQKRARLMAVARRLFAERGFASTTTADIARRAGVSEGIVFHHFGSKAELLVAVAADYGRGLAEAMFAAAPPPGQPPSAEAMLRAAFAYVREHGALARLLKLTHDPSEKHDARQASRAQIVSALARGLAIWSAAGQVRPLDPQVTAELLFALVEAALIECFVHGGGAREPDYLREAVRCVEGAVRPLRATKSPTPTRSIPQ
jgi:AcrR family transcriptional regulator